MTVIMITFSTMKNYEKFSRSQLKKHKLKMFKLKSL